MSGPPALGMNELMRGAIGRNKKLGGTRGDSAALNWFIGIVIVADAIAVIIWANSFIQAYNADTESKIDAFNTSYSVSQYVLGLAILTLLFETLYVLWVFADSRHPMRKAWQLTSDTNDGKMAIDPSTGQPWTFPGFATMRFDKMSRLTTSRLFAERKHVTKLLIVQLFFLIAWLAPFLLLSFKDGYITIGNGHEKNHNVRVTNICPVKRTRDVCMELAKAGIATGVMALLFFIASAASFVARLAKQTNKDGT